MGRPRKDANRVAWTDDPIADLRTAVALHDEECRKAIRQHGAPPPWPLTKGTPRHVIDAARRLLAASDSPCPTCHGREWVHGDDQHDPERHPCPDCWDAADTDTETTP